VPVGRIHDLGGMRGFGLVDPEDDEQLPFHEAWEARIFGIVRTLRQGGLCTTDEWRDTVERLPPATYLGASYYERWVLAAEQVAIAKGVLRAGQIDATLAAARESEDEVS
jgi:nitrile hydratase subunit beta